MPSYAAPAHLLALCSSDTKAKMTQEVQMKTINYGSIILRYIAGII